MTKTILLADDSLTIQKVVELTFADTPYNVVAVSSGDELLDKIPEVQPDLIICDIIMPGRDGYDVCQDIKSSPDTLHIPVILLSGTFEPLDRDRALAVGCSEILTKPFEARKLIDTVERLLRRREDEESAAGAGDSSRSTGAVPPAGAAAGADFGTRMSEPTADRSRPAAEVAPPVAGDEPEALEFTETGFAEMEAATERASRLGSELPDDHLDFEIGDAGSEIDPFSDLDAEGAEPDDEDNLVEAFGARDEPFEDVEDTVGDADGLGEIFDASEPFAADESGDGEPMFTDSSMDLDVSAEPGPHGDDRATHGRTDADTGPTELTREPDFELQTVEQAFGETPTFTADADTAPLPPLADETETPEVEVRPEAPAPAGLLSDDDVDRIARRLLELAEEKIEQIAWEVIPDVAEIVVRERIRKLEAEFETEN
jgi:CheY-like chemotaxis protein